VNKSLFIRVSLDEYAPLFEVGRGISNDS
jgi:hypothetical protein